MSVPTTVNPVVWFELPVVDMARAKKFYGAAFDFELQDAPFGDGEMAFFPMERGGSGAAGALIRHSEYSPAPNGTLIYFSVPDVVAMGAKVRQAGGTVCVDNMAIGEYGFISIFLDSEGNRVGIHQPPGDMST